jgi:PHD/YefM family antitoxin component YafN of YafNO toxin-antitoxin module
MGLKYSGTFSAVSYRMLKVKVMSQTEIQYVSDESGNPVGVIVPIELWREIESERETAYLLKSGTMKRRLLEAKEREEGIPFDEACEKLGI